MGYGIDFSDDYDGIPINPTNNYEFHEHQGFVSHTDGKIKGSILLNFASENKVCPNNDHLATLKKLNRYSATLIHQTVIKVLQKLFQVVH